MRSIKNVIAVLIGLCIAFILVELILRVFPSRFTGFGTTIVYKHDPDTGVILYPNQRNARFAKRCFSNDKIRSNSVGFRDDDWSIAKQKPRIAVLGDSFMEALQIHDGEFFSDLLEKKSNGRFDVMNFGISGYGTLAEFITYNKFVKQYRPDLVLLFFSITDVVDNSRTLRGRALSGVELKATAYIEDGDFRMQKPKPQAGSEVKITLKRFMKKHCRSCVVLKSFIQKRRASKKSAAGIPIWWHVYMPPADSEWVEAWQITEHYLVELNREVVLRGGRLVIFTIPEFISTCDDWKGEVQKYSGSAIPAGFDPFYPSTRLRKFADENGFAFYSLEKHFVQYKEQHGLKYPYFYYDCDGHLNELGHRVLTERVFEILHRDHLVAGH